MSTFSNRSRNPYSNASVTSSGPILLSNVGSAALGPTRTAGRALPRVDAAAQDCSVAGSVGYSGANGYAAPGNDGSPQGEDGADGADFEISCAGDLTLEGGSLFGQSGGWGGKGTSDDGSPAVGGKGGRGGDIIIRAAGDITALRSSYLNSPTRLYLGGGGDGGSAEATGKHPVAEGGQGARMGLPRITVGGSLSASTAGGIEIKASSSRTGALPCGGYTSISPPRTAKLPGSSTTGTRR